MLNNISCNSHKDTADEDITFLLDLDNSTVLNKEVALIIDEQSNITLQKDGTISISIVLSKTFLGLANALLQTDMLDDVAINVIYFYILEELLPGLDFVDLSKALSILEVTFGMEIKGLDADDLILETAIKEFVQTGKIPSGLKLPPQLNIVFTSEYYIEKVHSQYSGDYVGVYVGKHHKNGEPFIIMDLKESEEGQILTLTNEMLQLHIEAVSK